MSATAYQKCAAQHFGAWMVEPRWFQQAVNAVKAGTYKAEAKGDTSEKPDAAAVDPNHVFEVVNDERYTLYWREDGVARVPIAGQMTKGDSSFGGASSVRARRAVRMAANDDAVDAILLHIDSPGGTVAGTGDLAADVRKANESKPVYTYFEDLGASAAYWVGSQGRRIYANPTAEIGSIGTMTYVEDTSGAYEKAGIKVHLVSTGKYKGAWLDGLPVSDDYIAAIQTEINDLNEHFLAGVLAGRKNLTRERLMDIADGRVFIAAKAQTFGLIDHVSTLDEAMAAIRKERLMAINADSIKAHAAEHPEDVASFVEQGRKAGAAEALAAEKERALAIAAACPGRPKVALDAIVAGQEPDQVVLTVKALDAEAAQRKAEADAAIADAAARVAAKDAEIAALKQRAEQAEFKAGTQSAIGTAGAVEQTAIEAGKPDAAKFEAMADPAARAKAEYEANFDGAKDNFVSEAAYVAYRKTELAGRATITKPGK